jgi:hypothetical protein
MFKDPLQRIKTFSHFCAFSSPDQELQADRTAQVIFIHQPLDLAIGRIIERIKTKAQ